MKKFLPAFFLTLVFTFSVQSFAYENLIADDADLFSSDEEITIQSSIEGFSAEKNYSLAVVTTDSTSGASSEEYADNYYDYLMSNDGWQENGLLFLIDMDNRNVWISTCGECILAYSDSEIDEIINSGYGSLTDGNYGDCILEMIQAARFADTVIDENNDYYIVDDELFGDPSFAGSIAEYNGEMYRVTEDGEWIPLATDFYYDYYDGYGGGYYYNDYYSNSPKNSRLSFADVVVYILIGLAVAAIVVFSVKRRYKNTGKGDEFDADDIILNLTASNDSVVSRNVVTARIPKNNNNNHHGGSHGGGGFSGGGSSVHHSSGGHSHGGGGRGF